MNLGVVPYAEAWELQRSLAGAVSQGAIPDTILLLEHPPTVTTGRRTEEGELHIPEGAEVEIVETDRGGKSTFHGPGQLVCYPIFDLKRHGQDVKRYCRELEEALILTLAKLGVGGERIDGLTGVWLTRPPRKIASIGIHIAKWVTTHGYALNVDLDPAPFTQWITACGLEDAAFTTVAKELGRPITDSTVADYLNSTMGIGLTGTTLVMSGFLIVAQFVARQDTVAVAILLAERLVVAAPFRPRDDAVVVLIHAVETDLFGRLPGRLLVLLLLLPFLTVAIASLISHSEETYSTISPQTPPVGFCRTAAATGSARSAASAKTSAATGMRVGFLITSYLSSESVPAPETG